jgi:hypothetical protein
MRIRSTHPRDRGAVIPIVALLLPVLMVMTAMTVDLGRQRLLRRDLQADADVIALDLARLADGRTRLEIEEADPGAYLAYLNGSLQRNGVEQVASLAEARQLVTFGTWDESRPQPWDPAGDPPNAVRVTLDGVLDYYFQPGTGSSTRSAIALHPVVEVDPPAVAADTAGFSIGSYAAAVSSANSGMLNALIGDALGLGVLGYDGLATTQVSMEDVAAELGGLAPEELFGGGVSVEEVLRASAAILRRSNPSSVEATLLDGVVNSQTSAAILGGVAVSDALGVAAGGEDAAARSNVNLLDLLAASAFLATGSNGLDIPNVALGPAGMQLQGALTLIQAPVTAYGPVGTSAGTSQMDATLVSTTGTVALGNFTSNTLDSVLPGSGSALCNLLGILPLLCGTSSHPVSAELVATVGLDLASATGTIDHILCTDASDELGVAVASQLVTTALGVAVVLKSGSNVLGTVQLAASSSRPGSGGRVDFELPPDPFDVFRDPSPTSGELIGPAGLSGTGQLGPLLTATLQAQLNGLFTTAQNQIITPLLRRRPSQRHRRRRDPAGRLTPPALPLASPRSPGWRNRQTLRSQTPLISRSCGFDPRPGHQHARLRLPRSDGVEQRHVGVAGDALVPARSRGRETQPPDRSGEHLVDVL